MKKQLIFIFFVSICFLFSCKEPINEQSNINTQTDSLLPINSKSTLVTLSAKTISNANPKITKSKALTALPSTIGNSNLSNGLKTANAIPKSTQLGKAKLIAANFEKVLAKLPQISQTLPFRTREVNPQNIKYLDIEQGLKNSFIYALIEDNKGGIWIGSKMGISKYDGKFLTTYTETKA